MELSERYLKIKKALFDKAYASLNEEQRRAVFTIKDPRQAQLPSPNVSTSYVFATGNSFFAYPNNYNYYVSYYKDTFQHGGISMEEMLIPIVTMRARKK